MYALLFTFIFGCNSVKVVEIFTEYYSDSGGLAHRETGRFPGGPLLQEVYRAPGRTREFISSIISSN